MSLRETVAWGLLAMFGLASLAGVLVSGRAGLPALDSEIRFHLYPPDHVRVGDLRTYGPAIISPDGRRLAFIGMDPEGRSAIWVRDLHELTAAKIDGTSGAAYPFWSPDGSQIAYFSEGKLKRVRINSGAPDVLDDAPLGRGGTWSTSGTILFVASPNDPLRIVGSDGNGQKSLADAAGGRAPGIFHFHPMFLPDGRRFLFIEAGPIAAAGVPFVGALDATRDATRYSPIAETHSNLVYAAAGHDPSRGYLLYVRSSSLMAQPVDARDLEARGEARLLATGVRSSLERWRGDFSASLNGVLVYRAARTDGRPLAWYDRRGQKIGDVSGSGSDRDVSLSPDGTMLAVQRFASSPNWSDIWIQDLAKGAESRLTLAGNPHYTPVWAPNGQGLFFVAHDGDGFGVYYGALSERQPRPLQTGLDEFVAVSDASPDGRRLLYQLRTAAGHFDLWSLQLAEDHGPSRTCGPRSTKSKVSSLRTDGGLPMSPTSPPGPKSICRPVQPRIREPRCRPMEACSHAGGGTDVSSSTSARTVASWARPWLLERCLASAHPSRCSRRTSTPEAGTRCCISTTTSPRTVSESSPWPVRKRRR